MDDRVFNKLWLLILGLLVSCAHTSLNKKQLPEALTADLETSEQLVWVQPPQHGVQTRVQRFEKKGTDWVLVPGEFSAVVGKKGLAKLGEKLEGDLKTPQGLFSLQRAFGRAPAAHTRLAYEQVTSDYKWVDDPQAPDYNQLVRGSTNATSYERLLRGDELYDLFLVLEYNTAPIEKGKGSAIFMHLWKNDTDGTAGCVALKREDLKQVAGWLDPAKNPKILIGDPKSFFGSVLRD